MITIKECISKKEIKEYVMFPFTIYKNNPYWIPPLISDEVESFNKKTNPIFETAEAHFYIAYRDGKAVGRITAIINWDEVKIQKKNKVRFGWFDVIDDVTVTKALLEKVRDLGVKNNLEHIEGPMGFSNLDKVGVLTQGFDQLGTMITWYNHAYYQEHLKQLGFIKEKKYIESIFPFSNVKTEFFLKAANLIKRRYELRAHSYSSKKDVMQRVDEMFDLFNKTYAELSSFVGVSEKQKEFFKQKYISLINPEYIKFVDDKNGKMIAFSIVMPSFAEALQKSKGRLFPFGFIHLLKAKKKSKSVVFYLIGVSPEYQNKGVTALIFEEYYNTFEKLGIQNCIRTPELEENHAIHNLWKNFDPLVHKHRCTFIKNL